MPTKFPKKPTAGAVSAAHVSVATGASIVLPPTLADVALIDGRTAAATGAVAISTWHALVAEGDAPQPVIRGTRFTRWRARDVAAYWQRRAEAGTPEAAARLMNQANKATAAAQSRRRAVQPTAF